jgi:hypothetical protein
MFKWLWILLFILYLIGCVYIGLEPGCLDDVTLSSIVQSMRTML